MNAKTDLQPWIPLGTIKALPNKKQFLLPMNPPEKKIKDAYNPQNPKPNPCTNPITKKSLGSVGQLGGLNTDTLLAENVNHELRWPVVTVDRGAALVHLDVLEVLVEQVRGIHRATLGLGVELGRKDGAGLVHHTLVGAVVEVDKVLLEVAGQGAGVDGITVVLAGNMALTGGQVERRNVVGTVTILELDGLGTNGKSQKLVAKANTHDGNGGGLHQAGKVVDSLLAMGRVTGAVGNKDTVEVVGNLVDGVVVGENGDGSTAADQAAENVLLHTAVDKSNVELGVGVSNDERSLGAHTLDKVDLARVDKTLVLIGIVLVTNGNSGKGGTLLAEVGDDSTSVDARDGGNTLASTPLAQALDGSPMAVLLSNIGNNHTSALDMGRLEILEKTELIALVRGHTVVADQGLGEDQDLATVRGVGHGLGVAHERGGEDSFARDVGVGTEGLALEHGTILC